MKNNLRKSRVKKILGFMIVFFLLFLAISSYFEANNFGFVSGVVFLGTLLVLIMSAVIFARESALELKINVDLAHRVYETLMANISTINTKDEYRLLLITVETWRYEKASNRWRFVKTETFEQWLRSKGQFLSEFEKKNVKALSEFFGANWIYWENTYGLPKPAYHHDMEKLAFMADEDLLGPYGLYELDKRIVL